MGREVDVAPAKGPQLTHAKPGKRGHDEDGRVLLAVGRAGERINLLGRKDVDVAARRLRVAFDLSRRVEREAPDPCGALEDAVQDHEDLVAAPIREPALGVALVLEGAEPALDLRWRDVLEAHVAKGREQVRVDDRAVVLHRGRLAAAVDLDVAQVLGCRVGEGCAGTNGARQRSAPRLVEDVAQPGFRRALGEVAGRRSPPGGPRRADLLAHFAPVGEPVARVPDWPSPALSAVDAARRNPESLQLHRHHHRTLGSRKVPDAADKVRTRFGLRRYVATTTSAALQVFLMGRPGFEPGSNGL
jgi:hypothetical protein